MDSKVYQQFAQYVRFQQRVKQFHVEQLIEQLSVE